MRPAIPSIPAERFARFHQVFNGEGNGMWRVCEQCGGRCEQHKIGSLMPGEKEYIASSMGLPVGEFQDRYLDLIVTSRGTVDVLKLKPGCPFLDRQFHCTLADVSLKPVLCEIYPVVFEVDMLSSSTSESEWRVRFEVDEVDCPLMHLYYEWNEHKVHNPRWQEYRRFFEEFGINCLQEVGAPAEWYWIVAQYDSENFDYTSLLNLRRVPVAQCAELTLEEVMSCRLP